MFFLCKLNIRSKVEICTMQMKWHICIKITLGIFENCHITYCQITDYQYTVCWIANCQITDGFRTGTPLPLLKLDRIIISIRIAIEYVSRMSILGKIRKLFDKENFLEKLYFRKCKPNYCVFLCSNKIRITFTPCTYEQTRFLNKKITEKLPKTAEVFSDFFGIIWYLRLCKA